MQYTLHIYSSILCIYIYIYIYTRVIKKQVNIYIYIYINMEGTFHYYHRAVIKSVKQQAVLHS